MTDELFYAYTMHFDTITRSEKLQSSSKKKRETVIKHA
jgi:hypothetical protein